jgi:hypothetical protein
MFLGHSNFFPLSPVFWHVAFPSSVVTHTEISLLSSFIPLIKRALAPTGVWAEEEDDDDRGQAIPDE